MRAVRGEESGVGCAHQSALSRASRPALRCPLWCLSVYDYCGMRSVPPTVGCTSAAQRAMVSLHVDRPRTLPPSPSPLLSPRHVVEFSQNTLSGKRVLRLNGEELFRVNAQYKLTGSVDFRVDGVPASVIIEALGTCITFVLRVCEALAAQRSVASAAAAGMPLAVVATCV